MQIRDYCESDRQAYLAMADAFYHTGTATLHAVPQAHFLRTLDTIKKKPELARLLMLEEEGVLAGYLLLSFMWSNEAGGSMVLLEELYIKPEYRGKSFGTQAFEWVFAQYPHAVRYRLEVSQQNEKAKRLYERLGFETLDYIQMIKENQ